MVKNPIKIYARLKKEDPERTGRYEIIETGTHNDVLFRTRNPSEFVNNRPLYHKFRFHKIFDQESDQTEIFDTIAKPVIDSVLRGFNGTIFAYGQTGSGKTYAITGSSDNYHERGIIPRSIEKVFNFIDNASDKYTIYISYLEVYNEIGYDLLNPNQKFSSLEELPKVSLLEDSKGEFYMRNLSIRQVSNEQEAMRLLFQGDTNRTMAETPMNVYSSRSHCIFSICVTSRNKKSGKIRRSKLNLVDLAGSERVNKSKISGTTLTEAKYINLSLHYLEQVVLALSESNRGHVPYRNSMLTYILKDSLAGNCLTVLLATLAVNKKNLEETIATCKFAQRVAAVDMDAVINEEIDPQQEINHLRREIAELKTQLQKYVKYQKLGSLTSEETEKCKKLVYDYLHDSKDEAAIINLDVRHLQFICKLLKQTVKDQDEHKLKLKSTENANNEQIEKCKRIIQEKEDEISTITSLLHCDTKSAKATKSETIHELTQSMSISSEDLPETSSSLTLLPAERTVFETFLQNPQNTLELNFYQQSVEHLHDIAKNLTSAIELYQNNIVLIRSKLKATSNRNLAVDLSTELQTQQDLYKETLDRLQTIKTETEKLKDSLELAKKKVLRKFKEWQKLTGNGFKFDIPKDDFCELGYNSPEILQKSFRSSSQLNFNDFKEDVKLKNNYVHEIIGDTLDNVVDSPKYNRIDWLRQLQNVTFSPLQDTRTTPRILHKFSPRRTIHKAYGDLEYKQKVTSERPYSSETSQRSPAYMQSKKQENLPFSKSYEEELWNPFKKSCNTLDRYPCNRWIKERDILPNNYKQYLQERQNLSPIRPKSPPGLKALNNKSWDFEGWSVPTTTFPFQPLHSERSTNSNYHSETLHSPSSSKIHNNLCYKSFRRDDTQEFRDFINKIPLTGDSEVDDEIVNFYRTQFSC